MWRRADVCFKTPPAVFFRAGRMGHAGGFTPMDRRKNRPSGFTLIELVVSTLIVAVGIVALMGTFLSGLGLVESGRNMAVAAADARTVFEEMRRLSGSGLPSVTGRNWAAWSAGAQLTSLPNETVAVGFQNPAADPLRATVTVNWSERNRARSSSFTSLVTRR